jgi:hypothetical protein
MLERTRQFADVVERALSDLSQWRPDLDARRLVDAAVDLGVELFVAGGDTKNPRFAEFIRPDRKLAGDNPGTWYHTACIDPQSSYVIRGNLADSLYVGVQVYATTGGWNLPAANLGGPALHTDDEGNFTVVLGGTREAHMTNWLPLGEHDRTVIVRHYYRDRHTPCPPIEISWCGGAALPFSSQVALGHAASFVDQIIRATMEITSLMSTEAYNAYPPADAEVKIPHYGGALYPTSDISYSGCFVELQPHERLILHGPQTTSLYSSYVFYDSYFTSLDDENARRTDDEVRGVFGDGPFTITVAPANPDDGSLWISTGGQRNGILAIRHLFGENDVQPSVRIES